MGLDFVDAQHGWAVGGTHLLRTTDAGRHWRALPDSSCHPVESVHFVSSSAGFGIRDGLVRSTDGGLSWQPMRAPARVQSECFQDRSTGWVGTAHGIYATTDAGHSWAPVVARPAGRSQLSPTVDVQCGGHGVAWALVTGLGAAASQSGHIGWRVTLTGGRPLFAEQFIPHPAVRVHAESPGSYPGPFSPLGATEAAYVDWCPACGMGKSPWLVATDDGQRLDRRGYVQGLSQPRAASFASDQVGCVTGWYNKFRSGAPMLQSTRIECTTDGGLHWQLEWHTTPRVPR